MVALNQIKICGYKGFISPGTIDFAIPHNQKSGSGLTIITGPNNSGKTSIIEAILARNTKDRLSFTTGSRNSQNDYVNLEYLIGSLKETIQSKSVGTSEVTVNTGDLPKIYALQSRRSFSAHFSKNKWDRDTYISNLQVHPEKQNTLNNFSARLFAAQENKIAFDEYLTQLLGYPLNWAIDLNEQGNHFIKITTNNGSHTSNGLGEGILSAFSIVDSFYDSQPNEVVVIDEPELSLHPTLQKNLSKILLCLSKDRQVIISTHSPYFISFEALINGAALVRVTVDPKTGTKVNELGRATISNLKKIAVSNKNNPHVFGLDAKEIFFKEDGVLLLEGQEDVIYYPEILKALGIDFPFEKIYGWGMGGESNTTHVCQLLKDLGFNKVVTLLDGNVSQKIPHYSAQFPGYLFKAISADDIRDKPAINKLPTSGLMEKVGKRFKLKPKHQAEIISTFSEISTYLK